MVGCLLHYPDDGNPDGVLTMKSDGSGRRVLAVITARGGSRRIPGKNIRDFCGSPIIEYSIRAALDSGVFDEVMVSTDDDAIADISRKAGASVPFMRSAANSGDHATTVDALSEVIDAYGSMGVFFDDVCVIYPTAPFVTAEILAKAYDKFRSSGAGGLVSVVQFSYPPQRGFRMDEKDGRLSYIYPEYEKSRSQDLEKMYHDAGQFYFLQADIPGSKHTMIPPHTVAYVLDELRVQDIDNETDWQLAELKYRLINRDIT